MAGPLRVVTFNVRHGAPKDSYDGLPDNLAAECASLDADVLALQEVDIGVPRSQKANLAEVVADACGMTYYFAKARKHACRGQYGNALLVRGAIEDVEVLKLDGDHRHTIRLGPLVLKPFREQRVGIVATVRVGGRIVSIGTVHLAAEASARQAQLTAVAETVVVRPRPRILLGDLNIKWDQARDWLTPYGFAVVPAQRTPGQASRPDIDHVALDGFAVEHAELRWLAVSDHPAKIVDLTVPADR